MKQMVLCFLIPFLLLMHGACLSQQVISTTGTHAAGANVQLSWTIGEPVIETFTGTSVILTQGFHQSRLTVTTVDPVVYPGVTLLVYPNPVSSFLKLEIKGEGLKDLSFCLYDINGRLLQNKQVENQPEMIGMENYAPGAYFLKVFRENSLPLQSFKIVKNQ